ncbi:MAG: hypothetical protein WB930_18375 [Syntrophobacteraceae bacterium]
MPLKLSFVKGESGWKIYSIEKPQAGIQDQKAGQVSSESDQVKLVAETMNQFAICVNEKNMEKFYAYSSSRMQKEYTPKKLDEAVAPFFNIGADLTVLENVSPIFDEKPSMNEENVLLINGYYPSKPNQVFFRQEYVYEGLGWKLLGLKVQIK